MATPKGQDSPHAGDGAPTRPVVASRHDGVVGDRVRSMYDVLPLLASRISSGIDHVGRAGLIDFGFEYDDAKTTLFKRK